MSIHRLILPVFILYLMSCTSPRDRSSGSGTDSSLSPATGRAGADSLYPDFKTFHTPLEFTGAWVNETYVDSIRRNRSPRLDQEISESCIYIPDSTLKTTLMIYRFHEGGVEEVIVKKGKRYQFYDPEFKSSGDTIELIAPNRLRIGNHYFQKLKYPDMDKGDWGILNEFILGGKYQSQEGKEVVFEMNGHIRGLDTLSYYEPHADYMEEQEIDADRINMGASKEKMHEYAYQFDKDTLLIFRIAGLQVDSTGNETGLEKRGALLWKLKKIPG